MHGERDDVKALQLYFRASPFYEYVAYGTKTAQINEEEQQQQLLVLERLKWLLVKEK